MLNIASFIARLRPWQAFLWTSGPFFAAGYFMTPSTPIGPDPEAWEIMFKSLILSLIPVALTTYSWIWSVGAVSNRAAPPEATRADRFFNFAFPYALAYFVFAYFFFPTPARMEDPIVPFGLVMILHVFAVVCIFYATASAAMRLRSFEEGRLVSFGSSLGSFFLIWFFPIGAWFVQPRLNAAIASLEDES